MDPAELTLGEGRTALEEDPELAAWAGVGGLWVKREDGNPTGSHKDRGAVIQVGSCVERGQTVAVISSSGNAALSAATYGRRAGVTVVSMLSPRTEPARVTALRKAGSRVVVTTKPINFAIRLSRVRGWPDLRPSQSPEALRGFRSLGEELGAELTAGTAVVGYSSSGTTFAALGEVFAERRARLPMHPVQAGLVNGISKLFGRPGDGSRSLVGDLGVKTSDRAEAVAALVLDGGGQAWWVGDNDISAAGEVLRGRGYAVAAECWAALAGLRLAVTEAGIDRACLVLTGKSWPAKNGSAGTDDPEGDDPGGVGSWGQPAETFDEVLAIVRDLP